MMLKKYLNRYLEEELEYRIIIQNNKVNITNYQEIIDYSSNEIIIKNKNGNTEVKGQNLQIEKLLDNEILIKGNIKTINL